METTNLVVKRGGGVVDDALSINISSDSLKSIDWLLTQYFRKLFQNYKILNIKFNYGRFIEFEVAIIFDQKEYNKEILLMGKSFLHHTDDVYIDDLIFDDYCLLAFARLISTKTIMAESDYDW